MIKEFSIALPWLNQDLFAQNRLFFKDSVPPENLFLCCLEDTPEDSGARTVRAPAITHGAALRALMADCSTRFLLLALKPQVFEIHSAEIELLIDFARRTRAALVFAAHWLSRDGQAKQLQPLIDYQTGSVRDDFDFGPLVLLNLERAREILARTCWAIPENFAGFYALRLGLSLEALPARIKQPLYTAFLREKLDSEKKHFEYVQDGQHQHQRELEAVFSGYARQAGFFLPPRTARMDFSNEAEYPVAASVVIPVKDRSHTIKDAVESALSQRTSFPFNVIVVDNYSRDGTSEILRDLSKRFSQLVHIIPATADHLIGGCWNEAVFSKACGAFCVQLDSDDLYSSNSTLQRLVDELKRQKAPAVVGSYQVVDRNLNPIPPGLVAHREWTDENGHNNALRVNGFGAPRAFYTPVVREISFADVSYGEDYAMMLAIARNYRIARIYEPLYLCRRWEGNSDAALSIEKANSHNFYKDTVRSEEIEKRKALLRGAV